MSQTDKKYIDMALLDVKVAELGELEEQLEYSKGTDGEEPARQLLMECIKSASKLLGYNPAKRRIPIQEWMVK